MPVRRSSRRNSKNTTASATSAQSSTEPEPAPDSTPTTSQATTPLNQISVTGSSFETFYNAFSESATNLFANLPATPEQIDQLWQALPQPPTNSPAQIEASKAIVDRILDSLCVNLSDCEPELIHNALDAVFIFSEKNYASPILAHDILETLMDLQPLVRCDHLFGYMEKSMHKLKKDMKQGLTLLRICNELLRRASKNIHTVLCGRILIFLSIIFPLGDKSGVNLRGEFNTSNVTHFEPDSQQQDQDQQEQDQDKDKEEKPQEQKEKGPSFYVIFWSLQQLFSNPPSIFDPTPSDKLPKIEDSNTGKPTNLSYLRSAIRKTLDRFSEMSKREKELTGSTKTSSSLSSSSTDASSSKSSIDSTQFAASYFYPKFLTSKNLLDQEIDDPYFRLQILTQILMILRFLLFHTQDERAKWTPTTAKPSPHILASQDEQWVLSLWVRASEELKKTTPQGDQFARTINTIIDRDKNWVMWKLASCPPFEVKPLDYVSLSQDAKVGISNGSIQPKSYPYRMGTQNLTKVWQQELNDRDSGQPGRSWKEFTKQKESKDFVHFSKAVRGRTVQLSNAKSYLDKEGENLDASSRSKMETKMSNIENIKLALNWRGFRLASKDKLHLFAYSTDCDVTKLANAIQEEKDGALVPILKGAKAGKLKQQQQQQQQQKVESESQSPGPSATTTDQVNGGGQGAKGSDENTKMEQDDDNKPEDAAVKQEEEGEKEGGEIEKEKVEEKSEEKREARSTPASTSTSPGKRPREEDNDELDAQVDNSNQTNGHSPRPQKREKLDTDES